MDVVIFLFYFFFQKLHPCQLCLQHIDSVSLYIYKPPTHCSSQTAQLTPMSTTFLLSSSFPVVSRGPPEFDPQFMLSDGIPGQFMSSYWLNEDVTSSGMPTSYSSTDTNGGSYFSSMLSSSSSFCSPESGSISPPLSATEDNMYGWVLEEPIPSNLDNPSHESSPSPFSAASDSSSATSLSGMYEGAEVCRAPTEMGVIPEALSVNPLSIDGYYLPRSVPSSYVKPEPVVPDAVLSTEQNQASTNEILLRKMPYTKWVKLSPMSEPRISRIKTLAAEKGIDVESVESVLTLYSNTRNKPDNEVNRFRGDNVYIKITMGSGAFVANDDNEDTKCDGKKKNHRNQKPYHVKRPLNSFMLYRKSQTQSAMAYATSSKFKLNHQNISQIVGLMWQTESNSLKSEFARFAGQEKELHRALYPDYKFCPQKKKKI
jgi:hypothetical protein